MNGHWKKLKRMPWDEMGRYTAMPEIGNHQDSRMIRYEQTSFVKKSPLDEVHHRHFSMPGAAIRQMPPIYPASPEGAMTPASMASTRVERSSYTERRRPGAASA